MNGWFPRFNRRGDVASGSGSVWVNGQQVADPGWNPEWLRDDSVLFKGPGDCPFSVHLTNGLTEQLSTTPSTQYAAGAGNWKGNGYDAHGGRVIFVAVDPVTGDLAELVEYHGQNENRSLFLRGQAIVEHQGVGDPCLRDGLLVWTKWVGRTRETWGFNGSVQPLTVFADGEGHPTPVMASGPWVLVQTNLDLRLHPWGSSNGYLIATGEDQNLNPDVRYEFVVDQLQVVYNDGAGNIGRTHLGLNEPRVDLTVGDVIVPPVKPKPIPLEQVEPLVGDFFVGYYEQNGNVPDGKLPPGNAMVAVRNQNNQHGPQPRPMILTFETEGKVTGDVIGFRIGSEAQFAGEVVTIEVMEARARAASERGHRPWFYWDEPTTPRAPVLPAGSVIEVFGFCGKDESIPDWERDRRQRLREAAAWPGNYLLAVSAQTHDTNDSLQPEPSVMIPPMVRLCQWARAEFGDRFLGLDIFCNSGRDFPLGHPQFGRGGLTANPQLVPHWTKVFSGVTGLPAVLLGTGGNGGGGGNVLAIRLGPYLRKVSRGDKYGLDAPYDIDSDRPIAEAEYHMLDGHATPLHITFKIEPGADGRYCRGFHFKPTINGDHRFKITIWDDQRQSASVTSEPVTVTSDAVDPIDPIDPDSLIAPNQLETVQRAMRDHPEIDTMNEDTRGKIIDYACALLGGKPWGRKARNQDGTNKNTDGMTFLRSDGKFEIYDAISGHDGSATWEGFGPFAPGANGWWAPHEPV